MTVITENLRDIAGVPDNTTVLFTTMLREGSDDDSVLTPRRVPVHPVDGVLSVELDPGPASVTINAQTYLFTVPEADSRLWPLIEAAVAIPPATSAQRLAAAVAAYFADNPPSGGGGTVDSVVPGNNIDVNATDPANPIVSVESLTSTDITDFNTAVNALIAAVVDGAPGALDTLNELAAALGDDPDFAATVTAALAAKQPLDAELTALAALVSAADKLPYFTGSGTASLTDLSSFARTLLDDADAATMRATLGVGTGGGDASTNTATSVDSEVALFSGTGGKTLKRATTTGLAKLVSGVLSAATAGTDYYNPGGTDVAVADGGTGASTASGARTNLGLVIGTDVQAQDAELAAIAALVSAANKLPYFTGSGTASLTDLTAFARTLLDDVDAATMRTTLGLVIGTDVQAQDAELAAIAGLASAADRLPYFTGSGTAALATFTTAGRALVDDADAAAQRTTLGLGTIATVANPTGGPRGLTARIGTTASSSTPTANADTDDQYNVTALAANATFGAPTGTPTDGQKLLYRIKDNGTARTLAFNVIFRAIGVTLPTTTVISKTLYIGTVYNAADSKWDVLAVGQEA